MIPFILRPIRLSDLDALKSLTESMHDPIASLPNDKQLLKKRIELSEKSFATNVHYPKTEYYLFALEDMASGTIIGVSAIYAKIGGQNFFFAYEIQKEIFSHPPLGISKTVDVLHFKKIHKALSEFCSLYIHPQFRKSGLSSLLSFGRCFFIDAFPRRFANEIIANLRGVRDSQGNSPFWEALGEVFFEGSLSKVDTMKAHGHKSFIQDLMPRHPIYIPLLPQKAQQAIGEVHTDTKPALRLLEKQGFHKSQWTDIFDAGPYLIAKRKDIKIIQSIHHTKMWKIIDPPEEGSSKYFIANNSLDFRACVGDVIVKSDGSIEIDSNIAQALKVQEGNILSISL